MATPAGFAVRAVQARERIFAALRVAFPDANMPTIPQTSKYGPLHLQAAQWEAFADGIEEMVGIAEPEVEDVPVSTAYDDLSNGELKKMIADRGLDAYVEPSGKNGRVVKDDLLKVLTDADSGVFGAGFEPVETGETDDEFDADGLDAEGDAFDSEGSASNDFDGQPVSAN